jgi:hypothetical protein
MPDHPALDLVRQLTAQLVEAERVIDYLLGEFSRLHMGAISSQDRDLRRMAVAMHGRVVHRVRPIQALTADQLASGKSNTP